jgi:undecaprenyl diphosphate synthase
MSNIQNIPGHLGIIMDGNRRWAEENGFSTFKGHRLGSENVKKILRLCANKGIKILTVYALSTENWLKRSKNELNGLMRILREFMIKERKKLDAEGISINILGDISVFPESLRQVIKETVEMLSKNKKFVFNIAINYGGRGEIIRAIKKIAKEGINVEKLSEEMMGKYLDTKNLPDPDMIIRTGDEKRISNFLIWQGAYAEFYFPQVFWPEFGEKELDEAIDEFKERKRRFGE